MLIVSQMAQRIEHRLILFGADQRIGEYHHQRAPVQLLGSQVDGAGHRRGSHRAVLGLERRQKPVEQAQQVALVCPIAAALRMQVDVLTEQRESKCVALTVQQLDEDGGGIHRKGHLVGLVGVALPFQREEHRGALVDQQLAAQVGLLFKLLYKKLVGATIEVPIDVARRFARVVLPVVGEFDRETMKRTLMLARDEAFHHLASIKVECFISRKIF